MSARLDKAALVATLRQRLGAELEASTRRAHDAAEAATHVENRAEGDKDTRATEASYVARGQAARVRELEQAIAKLGAMPVRDFADGEGIAVSAIVELEHDGKASRVFLVTAAGGEALPCAEAPDLRTLATSSPLGSALLGLAEGDEAEVTTPQGPRTYQIHRVR